MTSPLAASRYALETAAAVRAARLTMPAIDPATSPHDAAVGIDHERRLLDELRNALAVQQRAHINYAHAATAVEAASTERSAADATVEQLQAAIRAHLSGAR